MFGHALVLGLGATLLMDAWNLFLKRGFGVPSLDYGLLGRWILHMTGGRFAHPGIAKSPARRFERPVGYLAHYSIGVAFAVAFLAVAPAGWTGAPSPGPAVLFGVATVVFPFFVMQPAMGLGVASSRAPRPLRARLKSLATHAVFGVGLYLAAVAAAWAAPGS
jgi:hypothetical protein